MAHQKTYLGEELELLGGASDGGFARMATRVKLYTNASVPAKDGTGFVEVANGFGYLTNGKAITRSDWTYVSGPSRISLADQVWTATGGTIANIAGSYITNAAGDVMAWWERTSPLTLLDGEAVTDDDLTIQAS